MKRTPLYQEHVGAGARMVPFAGYEMPVQYTGVVDEHNTVRTAVGLFDVSHMGEVEFRGPRAIEAANRIITNDLTKIADGQALYTAMCRDDGGIIDDLVAYRVGPEHVFICVNASNREKDFAWMRDRAAGACEVIDRSDEFAQIAVQGPKAAELVARQTGIDVNEIAPFRFVERDGMIVARTGYTGEDGFELYVPAARAACVWRELLGKGADLGVKPIGLGARDSLRLEMKFALYGNDIDETTNPIEAGLGWVVKLEKGDFIGRAAIEKVKAEGPRRKLVGFEMIDRGIARHGYPIVRGGKPIGVVTSGTHGPSVGKAIGMAYVPPELSAIGSEIFVDIRGKPVKARVVKTPFYVRRVKLP